MAGYILPRPKTENIVLLAWRDIDIVQRTSIFKSDITTPIVQLPQTVICDDEHCYTSAETVIIRKSVDYQLMNYYVLD